MSVQRADSQPSYPVTTTTTHGTATTATITTTTAIDAKSAASAPPSLVTRPVGWHAKASGFDWSNRSEQDHYRLSIGLPELHAAVINHDWKTAGKLLSPDDIGLLWLPPVSQRYSANDGRQSENGAWASTLPSKYNSIRLEAIRQMAIDMGAKTLVEGTGCLYGSNLLTLCLQISTPPEFMEKLMSMIKEKSSHYLNLPDASGRTPLYIAVDQENEAQIRRLLEAGATPNTPCKFAAEGLTLTTLQAGSSSASKRQRLNDDPLNSRDNPIPVITAYDHALAKGNHKIFSLLFENLLHSSNWQQGYPIKEDPLQLEKWASLHSETELRTLASQFHGLKSFLFNLKDQSGTSIVERTLVRKEPLDSDVTPLFCKDPALGAIYAAAVSADITSFIHRLGTYLCPPSDASTITHAETLLKLFLEYCDPADIDHLYNLSLESKPLMQNVIGQTYHSLKLPFDKFAVLAKLMWPILKESEREFIVSQTAAVDARYTELVIQLGGFAMKRNDYAVSQMVKYAPYAANTTAFEFGMAHLDVFDYLNDMMKSQEDPECAPIIRGLVISTIHARSLLWFEKFMAAGLHLQPLIDSDSELILPLIADLHPERLSTWLSGMKYTINDQMIEDTRTSQGRDALLKLIKPEKAATQKTGTGKSDA